jgi:hypothetical protein
LRGPTITLSMSGRRNLNLKLIVALELVEHD